MVDVQGYCRVAKIIRYLVKNHDGSDADIARSTSVILRDAKLDSVLKLRDLLRLFVKAGVYNTEQYGHDTGTKYHVSRT